MFVQIREYLGERRACLRRPGVYTAIGGREGCKGSGGPERVKEGEGDGDGGSGEAGGGVEDVGGYRVWRRGCCGPGHGGASNMTAPFAGGGDSAFRSDN